MPKKLFCVPNRRETYYGSKCPNLLCFNYLIHSQTLSVFHCSPFVLMKTKGGLKKRERGPDAMEVVPPKKKRKSPTSSKAAVVDAAPAKRKKKKKMSQNQPEPAAVKRHG